MKITEKVLDICRKNYEDNCGRCPIRRECTAQVGPGREPYERWVGRLNEVASGLEKEELL